MSYKYEGEKTTELPLFMYYRLYFGFYNISQNTSILWFLYFSEDFQGLEELQYTVHSLSLKKKSVNTCPSSQAPLEACKGRSSYSSTHPPTHLPYP